MTYIWAWHEALVERQSVLAAVDLGARGERGPHEVVDGVGSDVRERLLHAQQQVLHDHPVSAGNRQMTVVVVKPSSDRHTGPSSSRVYYSHLFLRGGELPTSPPQRKITIPPNGCQNVCYKSFLATTVNYKYITETCF